MWVLFGLGPWMGDEGKCPPSAAFLLSSCSVTETEVGVRNFRRNWECNKLRRRLAEEEEAAEAEVPGRGLADSEGWEKNIDCVEKMLK